MAAYQNNFLIEIEEYYGSLLNDDGLTNQQALGKVKETYGEHGPDAGANTPEQYEKLDAE